MIRICCYCGKELEKLIPTTENELTGLDQEAITHACCHDCYEKEVQKMDADKYTNHDEFFDEDDFP